MVISVVGEVEKIELEVVEGKKEGEKGEIKKELKVKKIVLILDIGGRLDLKELLSCSYCSVVYDSGKGLVLELSNQSDGQNDSMLDSLVQTYNLEIGDKLELTFDENGELKKVSFVG